MNADRMKVMVIDDELGTRESIRMILQDHYEVITAEDPIKALEALAQQPVEVVITDIRMPQMNGLEVLKQLRRVAPDTAVIMITAYASLTTAQEALRNDALDYLSKPFSRKVLEDAVAKAFIHIARRRSP